MGESRSVDVSSQLSEDLKFKFPDEGVRVCIIEVELVLAFLFQNLFYRNHQEYGTRY